MPNNTQFYTQRISFYKDKLAQLKRKDVQLSALRFSIILLAGLCFYLYLDGKGAVLGIAVGALCVVFGVALKQHWRLRRNKKRAQNLLQINTDELAYTKGDLSAFDGGDRFKNPEHIYANDLDVFGETSLYQHLNRTVTRGGANGLADQLLHKNEASITERQATIQELAALPEWRQEFLATGIEVEEDAGLKQKLALWLNKDYSSALAHPVLLYVLTAVSLGFLVNVMVQNDLQSFKWFGYAMGFNLMVVFSQFKKISEAYKDLGGIAHSLKMYAGLLQHIEQQNFASADLNSVKNKLNGEASAAIQKLSKILSAFDQMNNIVVLPLTNGLYLNHLHVLRRLNLWKKAHGKEVAQWLEVAATFDARISVANYAFNHADFTYPEVSSQTVFEAESLGHPMISAEKRVNNPLNFDGYKYVVLTGSNMSGKSTLLRSVGVNLILMHLGAPVCAARFTSYPFTILTSMKLVDALNKDRSYFQAEVLKLREVLDVLESGTPCFVLLDEILRGTNSDDKRQGTRLFMEKLKDFNALGVVATHDIDIADLASADAETYRACYFESTVQNGELHFDYILRDGICTTPNATDLMRAKGIID